MAISKKIQEFTQKSSWIRKMFEEGARLKSEYGADNVFDFSLGNPDVEPPAVFSETLQRVVAEDLPGSHAYMANAGYSFVRDALAGSLTKEQGVGLSGDDIIMTCGAAGGLNVVFRTILDPGDEVIIISPFFVEYHFYIDNHGGVAKVVSSDENFNLDMGAIEAAITDKTKAVLINSPNNPSGQVYSSAALQELGELLERAGKKFSAAIYLISDEPYRKIVFAGCAVPPVLNVSRNSIVVSSFSKDLSLPGERIGYIAVNPDIDEREAILSGLTLANRILGFVNAPALMQRVVGQLGEVSVDSSIYEARLSVFAQVLDEAGFDYVKPKGAFYIFPKTPIDDVEFCRLLQQEKILAVPGRGFGVKNHIRLAFCVPDGVIARSADGFKRAMAAAKG